MTSRGPDDLRKWSHTVKYVPAERSLWDRVICHPVTFFVSLTSLLLLILWAVAQLSGVL